MGNRADLHGILKRILGSDQVFFQPPASLRLTYPCIIYEKTAPAVRKADNVLYFSKAHYTVTIIDRNPDSTIPDRIAELPYASYDRGYVSNNLHHTVYELYY